MGRPQGGVQEWAVVASSAGAGDSDKLVRLDAGGQLDNSFMPTGSALTQTYSTADATHAALTSSDLTDNTGGTASTTIGEITGSGADAGINGNFASLTENMNEVRDDLIDLKQFVNSLVDILQSKDFPT